MIQIESGLYLRVQQTPLRPHPLPLDSGFSKESAYRALGIYSASETSECYFIVANDRDETWFISNRHFRAVGLFPERRELHIALATLMRSPPHCESGQFAKGHSATDAMTEIEA